MEITTAVGPVQIVSENEAAWNIFREEIEPGIEELHLEFKTSSPQIPPRTEISWSIPQLDIQTRWNPIVVHTKSIPADWGASIASNLAFGAPVMTFLNLHGENRMTIAVSDAMRPVILSGGVNEEQNRIACQIVLFSQAESPIPEYKTVIRLDMRSCFYAEVLRDITHWFARFEEYRPAPVPAQAFEPVYSTWYSYHQNLFAGELEAECTLAAEAGLSGVIVDDGWQTDDNNRGYAFCGDWKISARRFPDMKAHVQKIHALGMKYMLWYSVPFMGYQSENYEKFRGKYLFHFDRLNASVLDPRFPEVRKFLINTYETAIREWDLDGFKLDFIDSFRFDGVDPAIAEDYAGRDIKSLPLAVNRLLSDVMSRLRLVKPEILIEFRQNYIGPAIRKYGNMFRAGDCPADIHTNRIRTIDLRLLSGDTAVHSDMLEWNLNDSVEIAALQFLNILFSVPQISIRFAELPADHKKMLQFWLEFSKDHRETLLKSNLIPLHPEMNYPVVTAESEEEEITAVYLSGQVIKTGSVSKTCFIINASGREEMILDLSSVPASAVMFNTRGEQVTPPVLQDGLNRILVPCSGLLKLSF